MNPYKILGVKKRATPKEIRDAYLAKCKVMHPDAGGGHDEFVALASAYELLIDPLRRNEFDRTGFTPDDPRAELRNAAMANLQDMFLQLCDKIPTEEMERIDIIATMRSAAQNGIGLHQAKLAILIQRENKIARQIVIIKKRMKHKKKKTPVFFIEALQAKLDGIKAERLPVEHMIKVITAAEEFLTEYRFEFEEMMQPIRWAPLL